MENLEGSKKTTNNNENSQGGVSQDQSNRVATSREDSYRRLSSNKGSEE